MQISYPGLGGVTTIALAILRSPVMECHEKSIYFYGNEPLIDIYLNSSELKGSSIREFCTVDRGRVYQWYKMARALLRERPDVIVCHSYNAIIPVWLMSSFLKSRIIVVEHTSRNAKNFFHRLLGFLSIRVCDFFVLLVDSERDRILNGSLCSSSIKPKLRVIPNGVNIGIFHPTSPCKVLSKITFKIGMAGRLDHPKRQDILVKVLSDLLRNDSTPWSLELAGDGCERGNLIGLAQELGVSDRIRFLGILNETDLAEWFRKLDLYVHLSDAEMFSTAVLQAAASRVPIIASRIDGIIPKSGLKNIVSVCHDNLDEVSDAIRHVYQDYPNAISRAKKLQVHISSRFNDRVMIQRYAKLILQANANIG